MTKDVGETTAHRPSKTAFVLDRERPVLTHRQDLPPASWVVPHHHPRGQFLWAAEGVLRVTTESEVWIVPTSHGVWIPGGTVHQLVTETRALTRNLYVDPHYTVRPQGEGCAVLLLSPLMRELILRLNAMDLDADPERSRRLGWVAIDEIGRLEAVGWKLPMGRDPRLRRLLEQLVRHPRGQHSLKELSRAAGTGLRTVERLFKAETGMSFRQWRSRLRLLEAVELLREGNSSTSIAYTLGFRGVSAFVVAFRQQFGCSPQQFDAERTSRSSQGMR